jgi:hypothetical protein
VSKISLAGLTAIALFLNGSAQASSKICTEKGDPAGAHTYEYISKSQIKYFVRQIHQFATENSFPVFDYWNENNTRLKVILGTPSDLDITFSNLRNSRKFEIAIHDCAGSTTWTQYWVLTQNFLKQARRERNENK